MHSTLELTLILLAAGVVSLALLKAIGMPALLGYVLIGIGLGPFLPGMDADSPTSHLAEFGVVFLMFSIGLEFSLARLKSMRQAVFGLGGLQVAISMFIVMVFGLVLGLSWETGLALGGVIAMSSTAIVSKLLSERDELDSEHGRLILGVLLFQDLAVAPLIIFVPALAASAGLGEALLYATLKAVLVLTLILTLGQKLMRPWFHIVAQSKSSELFMLNVLLVTLGLAYVTDRAGLSLGSGCLPGRGIDCGNGISLSGRGRYPSIPRCPDGSVLRLGRIDAGPECRRPALGSRYCSYCSCWSWENSW
jgi:CPA2 family monovalent cation:H+ antiporter-2